MLVVDGSPKVYGSNFERHVVFGIETNGKQRCHWVYAVEDSDRGDYALFLYKEEGDFRPTTTVSAFKTALRLCWLTLGTFEMESGAVFVVEKAVEIGRTTAARRATDLQRFPFSALQNSQSFQASD